MALSGSCWGVFDGESSQCWSSFLGPTLFLLYINDLPDDIIRNNAICDDDTILSSRCDQVSDLGLCLELTSELECDLRNLQKELACRFHCWKNPTCFV